jgi:hypothetical protein
MNLGAWAFMLVTWAAVIWLAGYCFTKLLKDNQKSS